MEKENSSKLPKFSRIKPPKIIVQRTRSTEELAASAPPPQTSVKVQPGPSFRLKRRSKSISDLRLPGVTNKHNIVSSIKPQYSALRRKSRSVTSLKPIAEKVKVPVKNVLKPTLTNDSRPVKRPATTSQDVVKNKVVKRSKVPDWDYKTRYQLLSEKHTKIIEENKNMSEKLSELSTIEEDFSSIKTDYTTLQLKYNKIIEENTKFMNENNKLKVLNNDLEINLKSTTDLFTDVQKKYDELIDNNKTISEEIRKLKDDLRDKIKECTQIPILKKELLKQENLRRILHNKVQDLKGNIRVFCRIRPPINEEEMEYTQCSISCLNECNLEIRRSKESVSSTGKPTESKAEFTFDRVFESNTPQKDVFEELAQLVQSALDGYNICVFAYGQTGSGKTYTMQGLNTSEDLGLIPRAIDLIFLSMEDLKKSNWNYEIKVSFLEIYNENVLDLLNPSSQNLDICFNDGKGTTVKNLTIEDMDSAENLKNLMIKALDNRKVAATNFNERSSRSHAVTKIYIYGTNMESGECLAGSVSLVDLAGSESAKTSNDDRLTETKNINKSLSALGNVMLALYNKEKHIPYRNSKLTYLLQSSLGGNSKTLMIVNISPFEHNFGESINSLRFAAKVKEVKMCVKKNKTKMC